ncbi:protein MIGRI [Neisseria sp. Marseille-Q2251]|uniref:protein MIGRI n=1 Tax=Neisseria sp. Marseille-Q2251 TaxID=2866585 RepID=UPI003139DC6A
MIGRLFRIFFFFALAALIINRLFSRKQKRALRDVAKISAWVLLGAAAAAATLFWYLVMLYFKHIPDSY